MPVTIKLGFGVLVHQFWPARDKKYAMSSLIDKVYARIVGGGVVQGFYEDLNILTNPDFV